MANEFEDKLTVNNGFPIIDFEKGRGGGTPDLDADAELWMDRGQQLALEYGVTLEFNDLFALYVLGGKHPKVAAEQALRDLDILDEDVFLVVEADKSETLDFSS